MSDRYLLDSNIFIQSHHFEYRFSFCGGFWDLLVSLHQARILFSINAVKKELLKKEDDLSSWVRMLPDRFFIDERDRDTQSYYRQLINWSSKNEHFTDNAKQKFASEHADPWLVAHAAANNMKLVTHEVFDPNVRRLIKIPNAAMELNVECISMYDFLERYSEGTFVMKVKR